jgi:hypothetical protein
MRRLAFSLAAAAALLAAGAFGASAASPGEPCANKVAGTIDSEALGGTPGGDRISGFAGDDALRGFEGDDCLFGGAGNDALWGGSGADRLSGGPGDDRIVGEAGVDQLDGGAGSDKLEEVQYGYPEGWRPGSGQNVVHGGPDPDTIDVANGRPDRVSCGSGHDTAFADRSDKLEGCEKRRLLTSPLPSATPRLGGRTRAFLISFRSLDRLTAPTEFVSIVVNGPPGCGRSVGNSVGVSYARNKVVRYRVSPFRGNGHRVKRWCGGRYTGSASVMRTVRSSCKIRPSRLPAGSCVAETKLGSFSFRVH